MFVVFAAGWTLADQQEGIRAVLLALADWIRYGHAGLPPPPVPLPPC
jgi:hypothetical protein